MIYFLLNPIQANLCYACKVEGTVHVWIWHNGNLVNDFHVISSSSEKVLKFILSWHVHPSWKRYGNVCFQLNKLLAVILRLFSSKMIEISFNFVNLVGLQVYQYFLFNVTCLEISSFNPIFYFILSNYITKFLENQCQSGLVWTISHVFTPVQIYSAS